MAVVASLIQSIKQKGSSGRMVAYMSFASLFNNALTILSGLLVAKWLLPEELGLFNSFNVLTSYIILVQLGIPSGLSRQFPYYLGANNKQRGIDCAALSNWWGLVTGFACVALSILVAAWFVLAKNYEYAAGVFVIGLTSFQGLYVTKYLKILYRSNSDFNKLTTIDLINSLVLFITIFLVWKFKFYGLCIRAVIAVIVDWWLAYQWRPVKAHYKFDKEIFNELMKVGFPIYWVANIFSLWPMVQRTVVLSLGGVKALGLFSLAAMVEVAMKTLANGISSVSFPKMAYAWGQGNSFLDLLKIPLKPVLAATVANTVVAIVGWFVMPMVISKLLPNYIEGTAAAQWMLWVGWLGGFAVFSNVYMIIQRNVDRLWSYLAGVAAWLIACFALYHYWGFNMIIFPIAMLIGFVFIYIVDIINFRRYNQLYAKGQLGGR